MFSTMWTCYWLSPVWLFATPWTVAHQALLSMKLPRQEYWSGLTFPSPGALSYPGIEPRSSALQADSLPSESSGKPYYNGAGVLQGFWWKLRVYISHLGWNSIELRQQPRSRGRSQRWLKKKRLLGAPRYPYRVLNFHKMWNMVLSLVLSAGLRFHSKGAILVSYLGMLMLLLSLQSCPTLCDPTDCNLPGSSGVGCHFFLQCSKVKNESEAAQSCPTLSNPMDCSLPGSSIHGIFPGKSTGVGHHCLLWLGHE